MWIRTIDAANLLFVWRNKGCVVNENNGNENTENYLQKRGEKR